MTNLKRSLAVFGLWLYFIEIVISFEDGAPSAVCFNMKPGHVNTSAQNNPSPFNMTLVFDNTPDPPQIEGMYRWLGSSLLQFSISITLLVTLSSQDGKTPFKGFLIEARSGSNHSVIIGSFVPNDNYHLLNCTGGINVSVLIIDSKQLDVQLF